MTASVLFLGGNGHSAVRLEAAREHARRPGADLELHDALYPGFEGRPGAATFDAFLDSIADRARALQPDFVYATGIGGLIALALRARDELLGMPVLLQGAVLWGLEHRTFARVMRGPLPHLLRMALRTPLARRRFVTRHLPGADPDLQRRFFEGYVLCTAFADFFRWMRAPLLRSLESELPEKPARLDRLRHWWGEKDHVVGLDELNCTERALGVEIPGRSFADWGHYR